MSDEYVRVRSPTENGPNVCMKGRPLWGIAKFARTWKRLAEYSSPQCAGYTTGEILPIIGSYGGG